MRKAGLAILLLAVVAAAAIWQLRPDWLARVGLPVASRAPQQQQAQRPQAERPPAPVETVAAATGRVRDVIEALGTLSANESVQIAPEVAGRITALRFGEGERVEKGRRLVEFDATVARTEVEQARANQALAEDAVERSRTLVQRGAGTQVSFEQASAQLAIARANLAAAQARLDRLVLDAPFAGIVGLRAVSVGAIVQPGAPITTLTSLDPIKIDFSVPGIFLNEIRAGQQIDVAVDAFPDRRFQGEIYAIDPVVEAAGRALRLRATIPNPDGLLRPGLFARVTVTTQVRENAVLAPEAALVPAPNGRDYAVFVVREGRAQRADVRIGRREEGRVEIVEGLSAGDQVVVAGQAALREGAAVAVIPRPEKAADAGRTVR